MAYDADRKAYQNPIYQKPPTTKYDEPSYHDAITDVVDAPLFKGAGSYAIGERNHIPCYSREKNSGAEEDHLNSSLSFLFGRR